MSFDTHQASYQSLRSIISERTKQVIFWTGAGCSRPANVPTWDELKNALIEAHESRIPNLPKDGAVELTQTLKAVNDATTNWIAFEILKRAGESTYRETLREKLTVNPDIAIPQIYTKMWQLPISGVLNLNIDQLAIRACANVNNVTPIIFNGNQVKNFMYVLGENQRFVAHLHGQVDNCASWVFTNEELRTLMQDTAYEKFVEFCFARFTVVFLGISASDVASGGFLEKLSLDGIDTGGHFWITADSDSSMERWAEKVGIRTIRYSTESNHAALDDLFDDLKSFVSKDDEKVAPIIPGKHKGKNSRTCKEARVEPNELLSEDTECIRYILNEYASEILVSNDADAYDKYQQFCKKYDEAIYRAWYTSDVDGNNTLFSYTLVKEVAQGAFGKVYQAVDPDGNQLAIKVLLDEVRKKPELLQCFRRGVRSMSILSKRKVQGMVEYKDACEIPAFVVMDWINGADLKTAFHSKMIESWQDLLNALLDIVAIIHSAHQLPERVLHRDIRPSNIMFEYDDSPRGWNIVVLDFDLSWHKGAYDKSINHGNSAFGYLSPEQLVKFKGISTRHSAVDSFGIGMTLFFMLSGRDPFPSQHQTPNWKKDVYDVCIRKNCSEWQSLPHRVARLIFDATRHEQYKRLDMPQIYNEVKRLWRAVYEPDDIESAEMIAEELVVRSDLEVPYLWDSERRQFVSKLPNSVTIKVVADDSEGQVIVYLAFIPAEVSARSRAKKWISTKMPSVTSAFEKAGWKVRKDEHPDNRSINIEAAKNCKLLLSTLVESAEGLQKAVRLLSLE